MTVTIPGVLEAPVDPYKVPRGYGDQKRPGVILPGQDKITWFSRVTSFISELDDAEGITKWREAHVLLGALVAPEILLEAARQFELTGESPWEHYYTIKAHEWDDPEILAIPEGRRPPTKRKRLWSTIDALKVAAGVDQASLWGTLVHDATEAFDQAGRQVSPEQIVAGNPRIFDRYVAGMAPCKVVDPTDVRARVIGELHAYAAATDDFEILGVEEFGAIPELRVGGTWDRVVAYRGRVFILDVKTGTSAVAYPDKTAKQIATYVHCTPYNPVDRWTPRPYEVDQTFGIVCHLPGDGTCQLHWIKIARAYRVVADLIPAARAWHTYATPKRLLTPFDPKAGLPAVDSLEDLPAFGDPRVDAIAACQTGDDVRALWVADDAAGRTWPAWLVDIASIRVGELAEQVLADAGLIREDEAA